MTAKLHRSVWAAEPSSAATGTVDDWRHRAVCREVDPELFFPVGSSGPALLQIEEAKAVCRRCPVSEQCLAWALGTGQDAGVWGGMDEDQRRALKRRTARHTPGRRGYKRCEGSCGQWNVPAGGRQKYCPPCAADKDRQRKDDYERSHR